jgi:hypothetical protein
MVDEKTVLSEDVRMELAAIEELLDLGRVADARRRAQSLLASADPGGQAQLAELVAWLEARRDDRWNLLRQQITRRRSEVRWEPARDLEVRRGARRPRRADGALLGACAVGSSALPPTTAGRTGCAGSAGTPDTPEFR